MFKRKTFIVAFLAVVLLVSFMDARVSVDQRHRRKPRAAAAGGIAVIDPTLRQASIGNLMHQVAGGIVALDPNNHQANLTDTLRRRKPRVNIDPGGLNQVAGGIAGIDPNF